MISIPFGSRSSYPHDMAFQSRQKDQEAAPYRIVSYYTMPYHTGSAP